MKDLLYSILLFYGGYFTVYLLLGERLNKVKTNRRHKKNDKNIESIKNPTVWQRIYRSRYKNYISKPSWLFNLTFVSSGFIFLCFVFFTMIFLLFDNTSNISYYIFQFTKYKTIIECCIITLLNILENGPLVLFNGRYVRK